MALAPGTMTYNGVTLGPGGTAQIVDVDGLTGLPANRNGDVARPNAQGMLAGYDFMGTRSITLDLEVTATGGNTMPVNLETLRAAFQMSTATQGGMSPLASQVLAYNFGQGGTTTTNPGYNRQVIARVRKVDAPVNIEFASGAFQYGIAHVSVLLESIDPTIYDANQQTGSTGLQASSGGFTFPATFPATFGTQSGGLLYCTNLGSTACYPLLTITGPCVYPRVEQQSTGVTLQFNTTLAATDILVVDCYNGTATLDGTVSRLNALAAGSYISTFTIPASATAQVVGFYSQDASPTGATLTVAWANCWA
jgi:hypothetical protein